MKAIQAIVYRYLTNSDFFNIYKPTGTEHGGGGQLYIDFLTSQIPVSDWQSFFSGVSGLTTTSVSNGPQWEFPIHSIGLPNNVNTRTLRIYQRRPASICIPNQNINTRSANRIDAWSAGYGFPAPANPRTRQALPHGLVVFLVKTYTGEIWAGWFQNTGPSRVPYQDPGAAAQIASLIGNTHSEGDVEMLTFPRNTLYLDETNAPCPFATQPQPQSSTPPPQVPARQQPAAHRRATPTPRTPQYPARTENEIVDSLFGEDETPTASQDPQTRTITVRIRQRNKDAVRDLKELYRHRCQISGDTYTFAKRDGTPYTEAHHLIPLGSGGADDPRNMIIVSPLIHKMLHYADVSGIDLSRITPQADGTAILQIQINGENHQITWHAEHANRIRRWEH